MSEYNIYYLGNKGIIAKKYSVKDKKIMNLSDQEILGIFQVFFSPTGEMAIVRTEGEKGAKNLFLDFKNKIQQEVSNNKINIVWSRDGKKIYYNFFIEGDEEGGPKGENQISSSDPDDKNFQKIISDLKILNLILNLNYDNKQILISEKESVGFSNIFAINISKKEMKQLTDDGFSVESQWSPDDKRILYSVVNPENLIYGLWAMDSDGQNKKDIGVATISQKTIWRNNKEIIVAIPKEIPENYASDPTFRLTSNDDLYIINIDTGEKTKLEFSLPEDDLSFGRLAVENLMITPDGSQLFFISNDQLYGIKLNE